MKSFCFLECYFGRVTKNTFLTRYMAVNQTRIRRNRDNRDSYFV